MSVYYCFELVAPRYIRDLKSLLHVPTLETDYYENYYCLLKMFSEEFKRQMYAGQTQKNAIVYI